MDFHEQSLGQRACPRPGSPLPGKHPLKARRFSGEFNLRTPNPLPKRQECLSKTCAGFAGKLPLTRPLNRTKQQPAQETSGRIANPVTAKDRGTI